MEPNSSAEVTAARAVAFLARRFDRVLADECDLSVGQYRMLAFLASGEHAATRVAEHLAVSKPSVTALVGGLVDRGYVDRRHGTVDRRTVLHGLTDDGRSALGRADAALAAMLGDLADDCDDGAAVIDALTQIADALRSGTQRPAVTA